MWVGAATVFAITFALDVVWAWYTAALVAKRIFPASGWAAAIIVLSGANVISFVHDPWMLLPAMAGAFCGTAFGMFRHAGV